MINMQTGKRVFYFYLKSNGKHFFFNCNYQISDLDIGNVFIRDVCRAWSSYNFREPVNDFGNEIIWNNSLVKIENKVIFYKSMYDSGILRVKDLFDDNYLPLDYERFKERFILQFCPFTVFFGMIAAIPRHWKNNLRSRN